MTDTVGDNARPTLDFLARTILECTRDIQPVTIRLEAAKAGFREHAPAYCAIPGLGTVQVATPPQPGAPRVVHAIADGVDPDVLADLIERGVAVAITQKPKKATAAVTITLIPEGK